MRDTRPASKSGRVLVVDDERKICRAYQRALRGEGFEVDIAADGKAAVDLIDRQSYDTIVSDISMPAMDGIELLRVVRANGLDVPVVLITGGPSVETAANAVELGAFRYLSKPVDTATLVPAVAQAVGSHRQLRSRREQAGGLIWDLDGLDARFASALESLWMAHQPIVSWKERRIIGYEVLVRSDEPVLHQAGALLAAAERLGRVHDLGRAIRERIGASASDLPQGALVFLNLHAKDLLDESLFAEESTLSGHAHNIVLEITERASLEAISDVRQRIARLRERGFRIAVDDLGAGYAGLTSFAELEPDVVKLDMSLIRGVDAEPIKQRLIRSFTSLCRDMSMLVVAEGVETALERDALLDCGCDLLQGYLFARPERAFPPVSW